MAGCLLHKTSDAPINERHVEWNVGEVFALQLQKRALIKCHRILKVNGQNMSEVGLE